MAAPGAAPLTLGTAGHIDHGKTVLVEALTGTNTDRLPEERRRGISIELGFALLELPSGRALSVVDVPGHERFVRTMVAGATGVDLFLLVVAADDGVMPQTREHLAVVRMLEVPAGVVALTKTDLVDARRLVRATDAVRELLAAGPYASTPIVPVCAPSGKGLRELAGALDRAAAERTERVREGGDACLHIDRSFTLRGIGTVVTGTLWSGTLRVGDEVRIEPSGTVTRVRSLEVHGRRREDAGAGQRVAVNLAGIDHRAVARGDLLTTSSEMGPTYLIDAAVELLPDAGPLRRGERVQVHHGTRESPARVAPLESDMLRAGTRGYAQLRLEQQVVPAAGDRFVLRRIAPPDTIGGGVVVDPTPRRQGAGPDHVQRLRLLERGDVLETIAAQLEGSSSGLAADEADQERLEELVASGRARAAGTERRHYFAPSQHELAHERLLSALRESATGASASRGALANAAGLSDAGARAVLDDLVEEGKVTRRGAGFAPPSAERPEDPAMARLVDLVHEDFLEPRPPDAIGAALGLDRKKVVELLERARFEERLERLKPGLYYHPDALRRAEREVVSICERDGSITIAGLRDELGTSRKYAQALLEHFDTRRLTRRRGDEHLLRARAGRRGETTINRSLRSRP
jgi:selenocysteine-specific elongation factor